MKKIEILIIHLNGEEIIIGCLKSIFNDYKNANVRILFNKTEDKSIELVRKEFKRVKIHVSDKRIGFAEASNFLVKKSNSKYVIFLNNDTIVSKDWSNELIKTLERHKNCVAVQSKIRSFYERDKFENAGAAGGFVDKYGYPFCRGRIFSYVEKDKGQYDDERRIFWGCGVSLLVNRKEFIKLGMFDEKFFMYAEELDFCWRANNRGRQVWFSPKSVIYHMGSFSVKKEKINFKKEYLISRNHYLALIKNNPLPSSLKLLFGKTMLELISLVRFPIRRGLSFILSLPYWVYYLISKHNSLHHHKIKENVKEIIYQRSIALDHFIGNKKTFKELNFA